MSGHASSLRALIPRLRRFAQLLTNDVNSADDLVEVCLQMTVADLSDADPRPDLNCAVYRHLYDCALDRIPERAASRGNEMEFQIRSGPVSFDAALRSLPVALKLPLMLVVLEKMSYEQVAVISHTPKLEVRSRIAEARQSLIETTKGSVSLTRPREKEGTTPFPPKFSSVIL